MSYEHHIGDIKKGDHFCEFDGGRTGAKFVALEDGRLVGELWVVKAQLIGTNQEMTFSAHKDYLHYGPELYEGDSIPYLGVNFINPEGV